MISDYLVSLSLSWIIIVNIEINGETSVSGARNCQRWTDFNTLSISLYAAFQEGRIPSWYPSIKTVPRSCCPVISRTLADSGSIILGARRARVRSFGEAHRLLGGHSTCEVRLVSVLTWINAQYPIWNQVKSRDVRMTMIRESTSNGHDVDLAVGSWLEAHGTSAVLIWVTSWIS